MSHMMNQHSYHYLSEVKPSKGAHHFLKGLHVTSECHHHPLGLYFSNPSIQIGIYLVQQDSSSWSISYQMR